MMIYYDLSIPLRSLIILALFLIVCSGGCLMPRVFLRRKALDRTFVTLGLAFSAVLMIIYTAEARSNLRSLALPPVSEWLCRQSLVFPLGWILIISIYFVYLFQIERKYRENTITRSSIKEGVDKVSSGLCFYVEGGRTVLVNSRMNELSHRIAGCDLQDAEQFWKILSNGEVMPDVNRLSSGDYPNFRLSDGSVWTFAREKLDGFFQLTAADTTLLQSLTDELREKNQDLAALNLRLRRYGENVDELARAKERLETKVRIHGELGQALLATRRCLADQSVQSLPLDLWRRNIAMLRKEMESTKEEDPLRILRKAAHAAGIVLQISGDLPTAMEDRQFFLTAASEAMTNAVFHAGAKTLNIDLGETENTWIMRFTNDGKNPGRPIAEGGGLSSLRRKAEYIGAAMTVKCVPEFILTIECRKEGFR